MMQHTTDNDKGRHPPRQREQERGGCSEYKSSEDESDQGPVSASSDGGTEPHAERDGPAHSTSTTAFDSDTTRDTQTQSPIVSTATLRHNRQQTADSPYPVVS